MSPQHAQARPSHHQCPSALTPLRCRPRSGRATSRLAARPRRSDTTRKRTPEACVREANVHSRTKVGRPPPPLPSATTRVQRLTRWPPQHRPLPTQRASSRSRARHLAALARRSPGARPALARGSHGARPDARPDTGQALPRRRRRRAQPEMPSVRALIFCMTSSIGFGFLPSETYSSRHICAYWSKMASSSCVHCLVCSASYMSMSCSWSARLRFSSICLSRKPSRILARSNLPRIAIASSSRSLREGGGGGE
mmetsp:Transcript_24585/g.62575  ORF Transcript_24585/g.62575 Transcript_24585/m.62575 type:complete len:254 (-) Transcript_24585:11-772(-)